MKQHDALNILKQGKNVFLTGAAGSGKTHVLREYLRYLQAQNIGVAVTASTGIAATHLDGMTIHAWSGMGIRDTIDKRDMERLLKRAYLRRRYAHASVLLIDEISMLHARQLDLVNHLAKAFKQSIAPFGGMQMIVCGDFFQLPPVARDGAERHFVTSAQSWEEMQPHVCYLTEQYRQDDTTLSRILNEIRANRISDASRAALATRMTSRAHDATMLYTHNIDVDAVNQRALAALPGSIKQYTMKTRGAKKLVETLKRGCLAHEQLRLKIGARVMFIKNNDDMGYVNGTLGTVVDFSVSGFPIVHTYWGKRITAAPERFMIAEDGNVKAELTQVPLRLAWAITVHKSQGMSLDAATMDLSKCFEPGMGYVALSRVRSLNGLALLGINDRAFTVDTHVLEQDATFREASLEGERGLAAMRESALRRAHDAFVIAHGGKRRKVKKRRTHDITLALWKEGKSLASIAMERGLTEKTIFRHIEALVERGNISKDDVLQTLSPELKKAMPEIHAMFQKLNTTKLTPVMEALHGRYSYDDLQRARLLLG